VKREAPKNVINFGESIIGASARNASVKKKRKKINDLLALAPNVGPGFTKLPLPCYYPYKRRFMKERLANFKMMHF
jgi:hypothetical protein